MASQVSERGLSLSSVLRSVYALSYTEASDGAGSYARNELG